MPHNMKYETKCAVRKRAAGNSNAAAYHLLPVLHNIAAAKVSMGLPFSPASQSVSKTARAGPPPGSTSHPIPHPAQAMANPNQEIPNAS